MTIRNVTEVPSFPGIPWVYKSPLEPYAIRSVSRQSSCFRGRFFCLSAFKLYKVFFFQFSSWIRLLYPFGINIFLQVCSKCIRAIYIFKF